MIVGNGMLANEFQHYNNDDNVLIFASGVSNSKESVAENFNREMNLLLSTYNNNKEKYFIYFSTCSINDKSLRDSLYVKHKLDMERIVTSFRKYSVFRLPQLIGKTNNKTIINYFHDKIMNHEEFDLWVNATRNFIDVSDVYNIVQYLIENNSCLNETLNIATPYFLTVLEIVKVLEGITNKKAKYNIVNMGSSYKIDIQELMENEKMRSILQKYNYQHVYNILEKYYS